MPAFPDSLSADKHMDADMTTPAINLLCNMRLQTLRLLRQRRQEKPARDMERLRQWRWKRYSDRP